MKALVSVAVAVGVVGAVSYAAYKYSRAGYESPNYHVIRSEGAFEIRDYPPMVVASTPMEWKEDDGSFMRLFRYIGGANESSREIAMTVPVFMGEQGDENRMSFVVPREVAEQGAPRATDENVRIETLPSGRFATYRFSGSFEIERFDESKQKLLEWVQQQGLETEGSVLIANYDPPFTPSFLRRNEALVRIDDSLD